MSGKLIANTGCEFMKKHIKNNIELILENPIEFISNCFKLIHEHIKLELIKKYESKGFKIMIDQFGAILKQYPGFTNWTIISGGTTKTMVLVVKDMMYIANVGDSSALLCSSHPILKKEHINYLMDVSNPIIKKSNIDFKEDIPSFTLELICDHSIDNEEEYKRIRSFAPSVDNPNKPKALFVYDDNKQPIKSNCNPIFDVSEDGVISKLTHNITFVKNVRKEPSAYITSPLNATYLSSLAFTRTIGDYILTEYGVTYQPEIQSVNLKTVFECLENAKYKLNEQSPNIMSVIVASDGVWDNWIFNELSEFIMYEKFIERLINFPKKTAQDISNLLIDRNNLYATHNFGESADNATAILMYITQE